MKRQIAALVIGEEGRPFFRAVRVSMDDVWSVGKRDAVADKASVDDRDILGSACDVGTA